MGCNLYTTLKVVSDPNGSNALMNLPAWSSSTSLDLVAFEIQNLNLTTVKLPKLTWSKSDFGFRGGRVGVRAFGSRVLVASTRAEILVHVLTIRRPWPSSGEQLGGKHWK